MLVLVVGELLEVVVVVVCDLEVELVEEVADVMDVVEVDVDVVEVDDVVDVVVVVEDHEKGVVTKTTGG